MHILHRAGCSVALALLSMTYARAILVRTDYLPSQSNNFDLTNWNRYVNLAYQQRFDGVGLLMENVPLDNATLLQGKATGTLIQSDIILTAAHTFYNNYSVNNPLFTPDLSLPAESQNFNGTFTHGAQMSFSVDSVLGGSWEYSAFVDRVSIFPSFTFNADHSTTDDIAVLHLSSAHQTGTAPSSFLPIYTGANETTVTPALAVIAGYGQTGDGRQGITDAEAGKRKLGGLVELNPAFPSSTTLTTRFLSPGALYIEQLPSSFLSASTAPGDSGGPLVSNTIAAGNVIIGVDSYGDGSYTYGKKTTYTRVSAYADWIAATSNYLGGLSPTLISGFDLGDPLLPALTRSIDQNLNRYSKKLFSIFATTQYTYLDPESGPVDELKIKGNAVKSFYIPAGNLTSIELSLLDDDGNVLFEDGVSPGAWYTLPFVSSNLRIAGLGSNGTNTLGFLFAQEGLTDLDWTTITPLEIAPSAVPEPGSYSIGGAGLLVILLLKSRSTRRGRKAPAGAS